METPKRNKRHCAEKEPGFYFKLQNVSLKLEQTKTAKLTWKEGDLFDIEVNISSFKSPLD